MHARCPHCQTIFRISEHDLQAAEGRVRCGVCRKAFDARASLQKELPLAGDRGQPELDLGSMPSAGTVAGLLLSDIEQPPDSPVPRSTIALLGWGALNLVLLLLLAGQLIVVQREAFAQDPALRPMLVRVCAVAGCELPARRAVERFDLVRRNVYAHPNVDGALIIDVSFANGATFAQPYPVLTVSLGDLRGEPWIRRHFEPSEYLPEADVAAGMPPGFPVNITLEVVDPGPDARTFEIDFS